METQARRAIVAVLWGPQAGRKAALAPGESLRVGRGERAGLVVASDAKMSALHFEITWDGAHCRFRDLSNSTGTLKNGEAGHAGGELKNGDWLKAGDTVFTLHVEGSTPPRPELDDDEDDEAARLARAAERQARASRAADALGLLRDEAARAPLHAVLDAARDKRILELCRESVEEHRSLYDGVEGETMAHVAPYIVRLAPNSRLLEALVREGWGRRWGVFLTCRQPILEVRRQLRRFLMVEMEDTKERVYFRYYDPKVLATFLPTCSPRQAEEFYGPIESFFTETQELELRRFPRPEGAFAGHEAR